MNFNNENKMSNHLRKPVGEVCEGLCWLGPCEGAGRCCSCRRWFDIVGELSCNPVKVTFYFYFNCFCLFLYLSCNPVNVTFTIYLMF